MSGEPFSSSAPHSSPPGAENWPTISACGTCTAVRKKAVGTSMTIASTCSCLSAETTSFDVSNTRGSDVGWIEASTASRLVVPIWTPICASATSASDAASAVSEPFSATIAWFAS